MKLFISKIFDTYITWPNPSGRSFRLSEEIFYPSLIKSPHKYPHLYMRKGEPLHLIISNTGKVESYISLGLDTRMLCEKCAFHNKYSNCCTNRMFTCNGAYTKAESLLEEL